MPFSEVKIIQVKPGKEAEFADLVAEMRPLQEARPGCRVIRYLKRFYTFDQIGELPRPLTKIVKCVKFYSYWEFETIEQYSAAVSWFFEEYERRVNRLTIMPFDMNCGETVD